MIAGQGLFQLTTRSESFRVQATLQAAADARNGKTPLSKSPVKLPDGAKSGPMRDFWLNAAKTASARLPSAETLQRLEQASKSDNKETSAQKMQQAKTKLQSLRLQAQMAAAAGDKQTLKRIAQEVAAAARDIASAARDMAGGIADSVTGSAETGTTLPTGSDTAAAKAEAGTAAGATAGTATTSNVSAETGAKAASGTVSGTAGAATATAEAAGVVPQPQAMPGHPDANHAGSTGKDGQGGNSDGSGTIRDALGGMAKIAEGQKALQSLDNEASTALAQARGLLAFLANAARARRNAREDDEDRHFFNELNHVVDAAEGDMRAAFGDASRDMLASLSGDPGGTADTGGSAAGVTVAQVSVTQVTMTATFLNITA